MSEAALPDGVTEEHVAVLQAMAARNASLCLLREGGTAWIGGTDRTGDSLRYPALPARLSFAEAAAHGLIHDPEGEDALSVYDLTEAGRALAEAVPPIRTRSDLRTALTPRRGRPDRPTNLLEPDSRAQMDSMGRCPAQGRKGKDSPLSLASATFSHGLAADDMALLLRDEGRRARGPEAERAGTLAKALGAMPGIIGAEYGGSGIRITVEAGPEWAARARAASAAIDDRVRALRRRRA